MGVRFPAWRGLWGYRARHIAAGGFSPSAVGALVFKEILAMRRFAGGACILAALAFSLPQVASAQTGGDLAIGYSYLAADGLAVNASS